jgi:hypothetical protein
VALRLQPAPDLHVAGPPRLVEADVPGPDTALAAFREAAAAFDLAAIDVATAGMARGLPRAVVLEEFRLWGCRDLLPIGHHAIVAAQVLRTIEQVGWEYAEQPLRALAYGMLENQKDGETTAQFDANRVRTLDVREDWEVGGDDRSAACDLAAAIREGTAEDAAEAVVAMLNAGIGPRTVRDGLLLAAGDQVLRYHDDGGLFPGLHAVTNASGFGVLHREAATTEVRLLALLQNASFLPLNRAEAIGRGGQDEGEDVAELAATLRAVAVVKAGEEHDWKYPMAIAEELAEAGEGSRRELVAAAALYGRASSDGDWAFYQTAVEAAEVARTPLG